MDKYLTFVTVISNHFQEKEYEVLLDKVTNMYGNFSTIFPNSPWEAPQEYKKEMGKNLETMILFFKERLSVQKIGQLKETCMDHENTTSRNKKRRFNLNPGFINKEGMFLVTHKPNLGRGRQPFGNFYIEKQYEIENNILVYSENTFSEYKGERVIRFNSIINEITRKVVLQ